MSILKIYQFGEEVLRKPCEEILKNEILNTKYKKLISDMIETMYKCCGVGLAAPQVGINKKIVIIDTQWGDPKFSPNPMVLINPKIVESEGEMYSEEGCLSFKSGKKNLKKIAEEKGVFLTKVKRFQKVKVIYLDLNGKEKEISAEGDLLCRCLQHEIDHLSGILLIDKAEDKEEVEKELKSNGFKVQ